MFFIFIILILIVGVVVFISRPRKVGSINSNKSYFFDNLQFSATEFYELVKASVNERSVPDVKMSFVEYHQKHILSDKRTYLRVERKEDIFDICAAPFGTGFFVSYWLGEPKHRMREVAAKTPYLSTAAEGWDGTSYYQVDTSTMFRECVKLSIVEAMENLATSKGVRGLSEAEKMVFNA